MAEENEIKKAEKESKLTAWEKFRLFVKNNKKKIIAAFTVIVGYVAGDQVGIIDLAKAWFGF